MKAHILNTTPCTVSTPSIFQHFSKKRQEERKNESKLTLIPKVTFGLYTLSESSYSFVQKRSHYNNNNSLCMLAAQNCRLFLMSKVMYSTSWDK